MALPVRLCLLYLPVYYTRKEQPMFSCSYVPGFISLFIGRFYYLVLVLKSETVCDVADEVLNVGYDALGGK